MKRIAPVQKPIGNRVSDAVVLLALALIPASYYLGFHLDWTLEAPAQAQGQPAVPAVAQAAAPAPSPDPEAAQAAAEPVPSETQQAASNDPDDARWALLVKRLQVDAISYPGRVSMYLKDLKHGRTWTYQPDDLFPSASLIKVPIMAAVFDKIHNGELTLNTKVTLRRRHHMGGSGSLKWAKDGTQYTVRQLLDHMIDESDNTATRMMIETVGMGYLQQEFPKMGLVYTEIYPEGMSLQSSHVTYENYTTAREMAMLLDKIYHGEMVDRFSSEVMLDIMKHQKTRARLAKGLPVGWEIAHKTGLLRGACHDSAVIFTPDGDYVFVVLTGQNRDYHRAKDFITHLGRLTFGYYKGAERLLATTKFSPHHRASRQTDGDFN